MSVSPLWDVAHMRRHAKESSADSLQRRYSKMVSAKSLGVHSHDVCTAMYADVQSIQQFALPMCMHLAQNKGHAIITHALFACRFNFSSAVQHPLLAGSVTANTPQQLSQTSYEPPLCKVQV